MTTKFLFFIKCQNFQKTFEAQNSAILSPHLKRKNGKQQPNRAKCCSKHKNYKKHQASRTHVPVDGHKIEELRTLSLDELVQIANGVGVENPREFRRQDLIFEILKPRQNKAALYYLLEF